ncbi:MAG TPA: hypothetical protein VHL58_18250 [Thermoanaerobaculia bacterium]|nr:hypothetical protein [Thermoanaerobaculia bacterium]
MKKNAISRFLILGSAVAGLTTGSSLLANQPAKDVAMSGSKPVAVSTAKKSTKKVADKHVCKGLNSCKGKGGCKTGDKGCAAKNSCKGKGGCAAKAAKHACKGQNACKGLGGCKPGDHACAGKNSCKGKGGCGVPVNADHTKA